MDFTGVLKPDRPAILRFGLQKRECSEQQQNLNSKTLARGRRYETRSRHFLTSRLDAPGTQWHRHSCLCVFLHGNPSDCSLRTKSHSMNVRGQAETYATGGPLTESRGVAYTDVLTQHTHMALAAQRT